MAGGKTFQQAQITGAGALRNNPATAIAGLALAEAIAALKANVGISSAGISLSAQAEQHLARGDEARASVHIAGQIIDQIREIAVQWRARKQNLSATTDPTAGDDSGDGYTIDSEWVNTVTDSVFVCVDNTLAAAVWVKTGGAAEAGDNQLSDLAALGT